MKNGILISAITIVIAASAAANSANADSPAAPVVAFDLTGASNYIFRGVSQTENDPAVFGEIKADYDRFYATVGSENVDFHNGTKAEYDVSAGWTPSAVGFNFDLGAIRYGYINSPKHIDTEEVKLAAWHPVGPVTVGAAVFFTPNYFGSNEGGTYVEGNAAYTIWGHLSASGALGRQYINAGRDYTTWNIGPGYAISKHFAVDLRYYDTDEHRLGKLYNSRFVASLRLSI